MAGAIAAIRPTKVISFQGLGTMILANTSYLVLGTFLRVNAATSTMSMFMANLEKYAFMFNAVAICYTFIAGAAIYGLIKLSEHFSWDMDGVKKVIYSPITACVAATAMVAVTIILH